MRKLAILLLLVSLGSFGQFLRPANVAMHWTPNQPFTDGLVAYYSFDEGSGSTLYDETENGNDGTITGATWTAGKYSGALSFDGLNDMVTVADAAVLDLDDGMTLEAWIYDNQRDPWKTVILKEDPAEEDLAYALYGTDDGSFSSNGKSVPAGYIVTQAGTANVQALTELPLDEWVHLAFTYDGAALRLYKDGVQISSQSASSDIISTTGPLSIGGNGIWGEYFNGLIDEVRIYDRALSATEIQADM